MLKGALNVFRKIILKNSKNYVTFKFQQQLETKKTLERELRPLQSINDHYPKIILTLDDDPEADYNGIRIINALDWLLGDAE